MNSKLIAEKAKKANLTEKEMEDVLHALSILEKVRPAEIEWAGSVLSSLKMKTHFSAMGKDLPMSYFTLEQHIQMEDARNDNEISKAFLN